MIGFDVGWEMKSWVGEYTVRGGEVFWLVEGKYLRFI